MSGRFFAVPGWILCPTLSITFVLSCCFFQRGNTFLSILLSDLLTERRPRSLLFLLVRKQHTLNQYQWLYSVSLN
jgi:hypothetical protein